MLKEEIHPVGELSVVLTRHWVEPAWARIVSFFGPTLFGLGHVRLRLVLRTITIAAHVAVRPSVLITVEPH